MMLASARSKGPALVTPALTDDLAREALEAFRQHGTKTAAADALGLNRSTFNNRLSRAIERGFARHEDEAVEAAMDAVVTRMVPKLIWAKTKNEDGTSYSALLKPDTEDGQALLETVKTFFHDVPAAPMIAAPDLVQDDLLLVLPLMDAHVGLHAWGAETGGPDYDLKLARSDLAMAVAKIDAITPACAKAVLLVGGDYLHADDNTGQTPASKHVLDVDGRHFKVLDVALGMLIHTIERMAAKHGEVEVEILRGNHDPHAHLVMKFALAERYRDNPRITVLKNPQDLYMIHWGRAAIFAHHGDKMKPERFSMLVSDICPFWSQTRHRYALTGHIHHDTTKDFGSLRWESLRAFCPPDSYSAGMGFGARRALQALVIDKADGIVLRAIDPIERLS